MGDWELVGFMNELREHLKKTSKKRTSRGILTGKRQMRSQVLALIRKELKRPAVMKYSADIALKRLRSFVKKIPV